MIGTLRARGLLTGLVAGALCCCVLLAEAGKEERIDWDKARALLRRSSSGEALTAEEKAYLQRARELRRARARQARSRPARARLVPRSSTGLTALTDMTAADRYKGEDGGLYGRGRNRPPKAHQAAADKALAQVRPLDAAGRPSPEGKVVLISVGMSNTTQSFSRFKLLADRDKDRSAHLVIVDCAQGGKDAASWVVKTDRGYRTVWPTVQRRLKAAGVTAAQVQVAWMLQARRNPARFGEYPGHARELQGHLASIARLLKQKFPNLGILYISNRIYAGYATGPLNPEPYSYESAFAARRLIQEQMEGKPDLNCDPAAGKVTAPLLLWGAYLWADGLKGRKSDKLIYERKDLAGDGTHPSPSGRQKVAAQLLKFFKEDPNARGWFLSREALKAGQASTRPGSGEG